MALSEQNAKKILYSFENGIVPNINLSDIIIGREKEVQELQRGLELTKEGLGIVKFISGEYGTGKTFLLHYFKEFALNENFIVANIQINNSFRFNKMEDFYYQVMHSLTIPNSKSAGSDFEELFNLWIKQIQTNLNPNEAFDVINKVVNDLNHFNNSFSRAFLTYIRAKVNRNYELANAAASWIKGEKNIPASLKAKFEVKGNIDKLNSVDFFKAFNKLIKLIGYNGFVVLIDELELIMNERADIRQAAYENIRNLIDESGLGELSHSIFVLAGTNEFFNNQDKGIPSYPALLQRIKSDLYPKLMNNKQPIIYLQEVSIDSLKDITTKLLEMHQFAYEWNNEISSDALRNWALLAIKNLNHPMQGVNIRDYVRKVLEILNIMEQNPDYKGYSERLKLMSNGGHHLIINELSKAKDIIKP